MSQIKTPKITREQLGKILEHHVKYYFEDIIITGQVVVVGIRGYFLDSIGLANRNDYNVWDDVIAWHSPGDNSAYAGNTDPSFVFEKGKALAKLNLGVYQFVKGRHKKIPKAFRAFPEGVQYPCTRNGKPSLCSLINIHPGGIGTWSQGCQTLPPVNWAKFQPEVYAELDFYKQKIFNYILIENREINGKQNFYDADGRVIEL